MAIVFRAKEADMFQFDTNDLEKTLGLAVFKAAGFITVYLFFHYLRERFKTGPNPPRAPAGPRARGLRGLAGSTGSAGPGVGSPES